MTKLEAACYFVAGTQLQPTMERFPGGEPKYRATVGNECFIVKRFCHPGYKNDIDWWRRNYPEDFESYRQMAIHRGKSVPFWSPQMCQEGLGGFNFTENKLVDVQTQLARGAGFLYERLSLCCVGRAWFLVGNETGGIDVVFGDFGSINSLKMVFARSNFWPR